MFSCKALLLYKKKYFQSFPSFCGCRTIMSHVVALFFSHIEILHFAPDQLCVTDKKLEFCNNRQLKLHFVIVTHYI